MRFFAKYLCCVIILAGMGQLAHCQVVTIYNKADTATNYTLFRQKKCNDSVQVHRRLASHLNKYLSHAYMLAGYDSILYRCDSVTAYFNIGRQYVIDSLDCSQLADSKAVRKMSKKKVDQNAIFNIYADIVSDYADRGYPFASIHSDSIRLDGERMTAKVIVDKGERYVLDTLIVKGEPKIRQHYLEKELGFKKGSPFSYSMVSRLNERLSGISFLEATRNYQLGFGDGRTSILLSLKNKKVNRFMGTIGILPNNKTTGRLLLTGDMDLYLINILGRGEMFELRWRQYESQSSHLDVEAALPYLFRSNFGVGTTFDMEKKDTSYINMNMMAKILYGNNLHNGVSAFYMRKSSFVLQAALLADSVDYADFAVDLFGISYTYARTDYRPNPHKGLIVNVLTSVGRRNTTLRSDTVQGSSLQSDNKLTVAAYMRLNRYFSIKLQTQSGLLYSNRLSINELYRIGGIGDLRGFDELSILCSEYSILTTELRYIFERESALFAFCDAAYIGRRGGLAVSTDYAVGIGVGIDLRTKAGIFSLSYALGKQNTMPLKINNSKIHFGYKNNF